MRASVEQIVEQRVEELTARISELENLLQEAEWELKQAKKEAEQNHRMLLAADARFKHLAQEGPWTDNS